MTKDQPLTRTCPRCGVAMVGRKADQRSAGDDTFVCVLCGTVVTFPFDERPPRTSERTG